MDMQSPEAAWDYLVGQLFHHRSTAFNEVRAAVKAATVPMPMEVVERIARLNPKDAYEVLREHPGYGLWERNKSYQASFRLFERAVFDFLKAIRDFNEVCNDGTLFSFPRRNELEGMEQSIQKELFAATNAAHSLVDHCRRVQKTAHVPDYDQHVAQFFGTDGLKEFVIALRTLLHHIHAVQGGYLWQQPIGGGEGNTSFVVEKSDLMRAIDAAKDGFSTGQLDKITGFIAASHDSIDLGILFEAYRSRAAAFHGWFAGALKKHAFSSVRDYDRCLLENRRFATRTWWNSLLGNWLAWKKLPDPYNHLATFLSPAQIAEVLQMPKGSPEQVDKIISFIDVDEACTDHIREQAYELFRRAGD